MSELSVKRDYFLDYIKGSNIIEKICIKKSALNKEQMESTPISPNQQFFEEIKQSTDQSVNQRLDKPEQSIENPDQNINKIDHSQRLLITPINIQITGQNDAFLSKNQQQSDQDQEMIDQSVDRIICQSAEKMSESSPLLEKKQEKSEIQVDISTKMLETKNNNQTGQNLLNSGVNRQSLQNELNDFICRETIQNCPQRSEQWYQMRLKSFGGSEIADLMGTGKYKSQERFFREKRDKIKGTGSNHIPLQNQNIMDWGSFFEPIHRDVLQAEFNTEIQETSLALGKNLLEGCHQSPDGLSVVATKDLLGKAYYDLNAWKNKEVFNQPYLKVLWEQKCPSFREPVIGHVPENYIGQIKLGLSVFEVCDLACFSDSVIRICSARQFTTKTFNTQIIKKRRSETPDPEPLYIGYIDISKIALKIGLPQGDVSAKLTDQTFNQIFDLQRNGDICPYKVVKYDKLSAIKKEISELKGTYICWKLVKLTATLVERAEFFAHLLSIFIIIGHQALMTEQKLSKITHLGKYVKSKQFPLTAENQQDDWYIQNESVLIQELTNHIQGDWHSVYVLFKLLQSSKNDQFRQKQLEIAREIYLVNAQLPDQLEVLKSILNDVYGPNNNLLELVKNQTI